MLATFAVSSGGEDIILEREWDGLRGNDLTVSIALSAKLEWVAERLEGQECSKICCEQLIELRNCYPDQRGGRRVSTTRKARQLAQIKL